MVRPVRTKRLALRTGADTAGRYVLWPCFRRGNRLSLMRDRPTMAYLGDTAMIAKSISSLLLLVLPVAGCGGLFNPPEVVDYVDLNQYAGKWYEIASYPTAFQAGCTGTTAEYTLQDDGTVKVVNTCNQDTLDGPVDRIEGRARVADPSTNAKLKVSFFPPFEADYWIIDLDPNYEWAVVSNPSRLFLWILSRTPTLDDGVYQEILDRIAAQGYNLDRLVRTLQPTDDGVSEQVN